MKEHSVNIPFVLERCTGFTIPNHGKFYVFHFDEILCYIDINTNLSIECDKDWDFDEGQQMIAIEKQEPEPFIGLWGARHAITSRVGRNLSVSNSCVQLKHWVGEAKTWQFENFSGDWEWVTFDSAANAFLFGAPYPFDFRYVKLDR